MFHQIQPLRPIDRAQLGAEIMKLTLTERLDAQDIDAIHRAMILHRAEMYGCDRMDAGESVILTQQLEQMRVRVSDILRPPFKARTLVPTTNEIDPGAESWAYAQWDRAGMAKIVANYADDIPKVATFAKKFVHTVETLALGYDWSWLDLLRAAKAGVALKSRKADAVRVGFEQRIEEIAAIGIKDTGTPGLLNHPNVPQMSVAAPATGSSAIWGGADKTPYEILNDLHAAEDAILSATKMTQPPDTLILPLARYRYIDRTPLSSNAAASPKDTILSVFLEKSKYIKNVDWWSYCDTANGGQPRALMYQRNPMVVHLEIPLEQQELPPQAKNLSMEVNSVGRIGGVAWEYPLAALYINGL
jgi:hypothetical protein